MSTDLKPNASVKLTWMASGAVTFVAETKPPADITTKSDNVVLNITHEGKIVPAHFEVAFTIHASCDPAGPFPAHSNLFLNCNLPVEDPKKSYADIELEAARRLAPFLHNLADLIEDYIEASEKNSDNAK